MQPIFGRTWLPGEDRSGKDQVAVLSYGLWREHFAGDPGVVGRTIALNSKKYTIVGVMPASFRYPFQTQMWMPQNLARADLRLISARLEKTYPDSNDKVGNRLLMQPA